MKKTLFTLSLFLLTSICYCQEKIAEKYIVQVTYTGGGTENIEIKNDRHLKVADPIVKDGSIYYDEEYLLLDVKKIKILKVDYAKNVSTSEKPFYKIEKGYYWDKKRQTYVKLNVISFPEQEKYQREGEERQKKTAIFSRSSENSNGEKPKEVAKSEEVIVEKDTVVTSTKQIVFEYDGNGNFKKFEKSGLRILGDKIDSRNFNPEFDRIDIDKASDEYLLLSQIIEKKGEYIVEKLMNKENQIVLCKILPIHFDND